MQTLTLNNNIEMPILGFGVYQITDLEECEQSVLTALEAGYRLIDTASAYQNEKAVGDAIRKSGIPREEIFITTKLWIQDTGYEKTFQAFEKSLNNLQTDYLDLYLIHQPMGDIFGSWRAMQELNQKKKIRAIGVSNFQPDRLMDLIVNSGFAPAVNQIEVNPFHQQIDTQEFLEDNNVQVQSWASFAEGRNDIFHNELLISIGEKYGKSVAQVILRWLIQRDVIVIPKSVTPERIIENFDVFDFELSASDMMAIMKLDTRDSQFFNHNNPDMVKSLSSYKF
ncbi:aldo/keto reductase [Cloacibacterium sp.]|uniref:aldo/keto reductase n=1 Tax=Cloacibacterium sp. TaxID=1913682 RepID=UPI0039E48FC0